MPAGIDVRHELEMVAKLQDIDNNLHELIQEKGDLPEIVKRMQKEIIERNEKLEKVHEKIANIATNKRTIEGQIQLARIKQDKYKEQLYQVTNNREYDAITQQIDSNRIEIEASETDLLSMMEEDELLTLRIGDIEERIKEVNTELIEREQELGEKEEETAQEELEYTHEREKLSVRIKKPVMAHYERIRNSKGVGAATLYASACGSCFAVVPPQRQTEIRKMNDIILCESCGVILLPEQQ
ncbi:MAG: C4-type zinc ribbon domain-containing protein [Candidatus Electryonea clarkiae]|nr:C4-type zinc ribbon domain-containing protein [Candidatus Electryonea clarkiae]MDP8289006.1 C4-type zinc ribbon domain-containing protein [Candidatus Electryonea clarkiae]